MQWSASLHKECYTFKPNYYQKHVQLLWGLARSVVPECSDCSPYVCSSLHDSTNLTMREKLAHLPSPFPRMSPLPCGSRVVLSSCTNPWDVILLNSSIGESMCLAPRELMVPWREAGRKLCVPISEIKHEARSEILNTHLVLLSWNFAFFSLPIVFWM